MAFSVKPVPGVTVPATMFAACHAVTSAADGSAARPMLMMLFAVTAASATAITLVDQSAAASVAVTIAGLAVWIAETAVFSALMFVQPCFFPSGYFEIFLPHPKRAAVYKKSLGMHHPKAHK